MLVDLPENWSSWEPETEDYFRSLRLLTLGGRIENPVRLSKGVYMSHFNFDHEIEHLTWDKDHYELDYASAVCRLWVHEIYGGVEDEYEGWIYPQIVQNA